MAMMQELFVERFRGIRDLELNELNKVNLIVGDNNCGKTSVLEALQLLTPFAGTGGIYRIARQRESIRGYSSDSTYDGFLCMFPQDTEERLLSVKGICNNISVSCEIKGTEKVVLADPQETHFVKTVRTSALQETDGFEGKIFMQYGEESSVKQIDIHRFTRFTGAVKMREKIYDIVYVSPFEHLKGDVIGSIIKNDGYKEICLKALQLFDPNICDMMLFKSDVGNRPIEYLKHTRLGNMPLSTFGDGIKKVLVLCNAIAKAAGGILLIDEIETAIHKKYYDDIFRFIVKACQQFDVQVFITTHSLEAIDGLLATQDYDTQATEDSIHVITLKQGEDKTYTRTLSGRYVAENREAFGFEVRL